MTRAEKPSVIALGLLFAPFTDKTAIFIGTTIFVLAVLPFLSRRLTFIYAYRTAAIRTKWVIFILFGLYPVIGQFRKKHDERWYYIP